MKLTAFLILARISLAAEIEAQKDEAGVLILKQEDFDKVINDHGNVLVSFCEPTK
jgi:hypothetical protein